MTRFSDKASLNKIYFGSLLYNLIQYFIIEMLVSIYSGYLPNSPFKGNLHVFLFTFKIYLHKKD